MLSTLYPRVINYFCNLVLDKSKLLIHSLTTQGIGFLVDMEKIGEIKSNVECRKHLEAFILHSYFEFIHSLYDPKSFSYFSSVPVHWRSGWNSQMMGWVFFGCLFFSKVKSSSSALHLGKKWKSRLSKEPNVGFRMVGWNYSPAASLMSPVIESKDSAPWSLYVLFY